MMAGETTRIPTFHAPQQGQSPAIDTLLSDHYVLESGVDYFTYKCLSPSKHYYYNNLLKLHF